MYILYIIVLVTRGFFLNVNLIQRNVLQWTHVIAVGDDLILINEKYRN